MWKKSSPGLSTTMLAACNVGSAAAPAPDIPTTNLILGLKADTGTFSDTARTTPVSADAAEVKGWEDQSGTDNHATWTSTAIPTIGQNTADNFRLIGDVFELIAYSSELSAGDRTTVRNYLNTKYGVY